MAICHGEFEQLFGLRLSSDGSEDIIKKGKDLLSRAKKDVSAQNNHPTGGGPPPKTSPYSDIIVAIFGQDSPAFVGLDVGQRLSSTAGAVGRRYVA